MGIITKVLQFVSVLTLTKCIVDLFKFLRWDGRYQFKLPFFTEQSRESVLQAIFYDLGLLLLFLCQHRLLGYLKNKSKVDITPIYGPMHIITSSLALTLMMTYWTPIPTVTIWFWDVSSYPLLVLFLQLVYMFAWAMVIVENMVYILQTHGFEISQWFTLRRNVQSPASSCLSNLFPHPGLIFFTVILWVTPTLTLDRWLLATVLSWYIYVPQRVTREDYKYFCKCYSYVEFQEQQVSYWCDIHF